MTKVRFRSAFKVPGAALLCLVFLSAAALALPAAAQDLPAHDSAPSSRVDRSDVSSSGTGAPADDNGAIDSDDRGLLDAEARSATEVGDGADDAPATASTQVYGADIDRNLTLVEGIRIRAIWLAHRSPVARTHDGTPRVYARPPPAA